VNSVRLEMAKHLLDDKPLFWAATAYDITDGTMPETDQLLPSTNGFYDIPNGNDGSFRLDLGPEALNGVAGTAFVKTVPGRHLLFAFRRCGDGTATMQVHTLAELEPTVYRAGWSVRLAGYVRANGARAGCRSCPRTLWVPNLCIALRGEEPWTSPEAVDVYSSAGEIVSSPSVDDSGTRRIPAT